MLNTVNESDPRDRKNEIKLSFLDIVLHLDQHGN